MDRPTQITSGALPPRRSAASLPPMALPRYGSRPTLKVADEQPAPSVWSTTPPANPPAAVPEASASNNGGHHMSPAQRAHTCLSSARSGVLAVAAPRGEEFPAPISFSTAFNAFGNDAFVLGVRRGVAEIMGNPTQIAASFAVGETPLAASATSGGGVTLRGTLRRLGKGAEWESALSDYIQGQPSDLPEARRGDIVLMVLKPEAICVVVPGGGVEAVSVEEFVNSEADPLALVATGLVSHLGGDENGTLVLLCRAFGGQPTTSSATMTGIDQYGIDVSAITGRGREAVRLNFSKPVATSEEVRRELTSLARGARFKLGVG